MSEELPLSREPPPPPPPPSRAILTRARLSAIQRFIESDRLVFPNFEGTKSQQNSQRDYFKSQARIFFIPNAGPLKGVLCTSREMIEEKSKRRKSKPKGKL